MKIIQITCAEYRLHALTEDGDVWQYEDSNGWSKLPLPVEEEVEAEPAE